MSHRLRPFPLAAAAALAACADAPQPTDQAPRWERLEWRTNEDTNAGLRPSREIARLASPMVDSAWRVANTGRIDLEPRAEGEPPVVRLDGQGARLMSAPAELVANQVDRATLRIDIPGGEREAVRLAFRTGERTRAYSDILVVDGAEGLEVLEVSLSKVQILEGAIDRVVLESMGEASSIAFVDCTFFRDDPLSHLPDARHGADLVLAGEDSRRGVGLGTQHPLTAPYSAPRGGALQLSYRVAARGTMPEGTLVLEGASESPVRAPLVDGEAPTWRTLTLPLREGAEGEWTARIESTGEECHTALADAGVLHAGGAPPPPAVVLITSDTHRGKLIGASAGGLVSTPALDALAARGALFLDATATTNATNPSHVALMTGLHPRDTRVVTNRNPVADRAVTLAERFAAAGYRTAASYSTFQLGDEMSGLGQGFDRVDGPGFPTHTDFDIFAGSSTQVRMGELSVARALQHLEDAEGAPLFLWLHVYDPHTPYFPPEDFDRRYYPEERDPKVDGPGLPHPEGAVPPWLKGIRDPEFQWTQYRALVDYVDHALTPLLEHPRVANGIVAFTSDHGENFGEQGIWWDHRGIYTPTTLVPLILAWPGAPSVQPTAPVRQFDIGHTLLELAGLGAGDFPGRDLRQALAADPPREPRFALAAGGYSASIDDGDWLLVLHLLEEDNDDGTRTWLPGETELFDRRRDPDCETDLLDEELERARRMRRALLAWLADADPEGYEDDFHINAAIENALAELGYANSGSEGGVWFDPGRGDAFFERYGDR